MSSPDRPARSSNGFNITFSEPKLGALAPSSSDWPEMATVWPTPSVSRAIDSIRRTTACVRCTLAPSGNCTFSSRYPLSCWGMNPVGVCVKPQ